MASSSIKYAGFTIAIYVSLFFSCKPPELSITKLYWKKSRIEYYLNKGANKLSETVIRETMQTWSEKTHFDVVYMGRNGAGFKQDNKNTISFLLEWPAGISINHIAHTRHWYNGEGEIQEADIAFNMQKTRFTTKRTQKKDWYVLEGVLSHEVGHLIGLDHSTDPGSIMKQKSPMKESYFKGKIDEETLSRYERKYSFIFQNNSK